MLLNDGRRWRNRRRRLAFIPRPYPFALSITVSRTELVGIRRAWSVFLSPLLLLSQRLDRRRQEVIPPVPASYSSLETTASELA